MSQRRIDIAWLVEHAARELDVACAAKHLLETRYGRSVEIASIAMRQQQTVESLRPDVVVIPYCYSAGDSGLRHFLPMWPEARYVNLAFEQVLSRMNESFKAPRDEFAKRSVYHQAWGDFFADYLRGVGVPDGNIFVNGNPSYALYRPPYRDYFASRLELAGRYGLDPDRRWVFVPENYWAAFFTEEIIRDYGRRGFGEEKARQYHEFALASLLESASWWRDAAETLDAEIIVRPRPAAPRDLFVKKCRYDEADLPGRLHVIKEGTIREWILASDFVASSYSTSLIEAAVAGKPVGMLMPREFPDFLWSDWYALVSPVRAREEFLRAVRGGLQDMSFGPLAEWAGERMMSRGDAVGNLAAELSAVCEGRGPRLDQSGLGGLLEEMRRGLEKEWSEEGRARAEAIHRKCLANGVLFNTLEHDSPDDFHVASRVARWSEILRCQEAAAV